MVAVGPQFLQPFLIQEHRGQIGLRIKVSDHHRGAKIGEEVVPQCGFADSSLVVEECDGSHGFLAMVDTCDGSNVKLASVLPLRRSASCARITPRPKWFT